MPAPCTAADEAVLRAALAMVEAGAVADRRRRPLDGALPVAPRIDEAEETARLARAVELLAAKLRGARLGRHDPRRPGPRGPRGRRPRHQRRLGSARSGPRAAGGRPRREPGAHGLARGDDRRPARATGAPRAARGVTAIAGGRGPDAAGGGTATRARGRHPRPAHRRRSRDRLLPRRVGRRGRSGICACWPGCRRCARWGGRCPSACRASRSSARSLDRAEPAERLAGSLAATAIAVVHGAALIRTHDVAETRDAVRVAQRLRQARPMSDLLVAFRWRDALDILLVAIVIYRVLTLFRGTRAVQISIGLAVLAGAAVLARTLGLTSLIWLLDHFWSFWVVAMIVVFQPELRRALAWIGQGPVLQRAAGRQRRARPGGGRARPRQRLAGRPAHRRADRAGALDRDCASTPSSASPSMRSSRRIC